MRMFLMILAVFLAGHSPAIAQPVNAAWSSYKKNIYDRLEEKHFISLSIVNGGERLRAFYCFRDNDGSQMVAVNNGDTAFRQLELATPKLFQHLQANKKHFRAVINHLSRLRPSARKALMAKTSFEMGIRNRDLSFGHFIKAPDDFINHLKRKKLRESYREVNRLIDIFHQAMMRALAKKEE